MATFELGVFLGAVVSRDTNERFGCGARGSDIVIAVCCSQEAKKLSAGNLDSAVCALDA